MSYDLQVWCVNPPELLPGAIAEGNDWIVNAATSACDPEDVPRDVRQQLTGVRHLVEISLEPVDASKVGHAAAWKAARSIAKRAQGVIVDPQKGSDEILRRTSTLRLHWWMDHDTLREPAAFERLFDLLERVLPDALPRRYGDYEPLEHKYATTGREYFLRYVAEHRYDNVIWCAHAPVMSVGLPSFPLGWRMHGGKRTFFANHVSIYIDADALDPEGWDGARRAWTAITRELRPFYGDARTLRGYEGKAFGQMDGIDAHPIRGQFWYGVPPRFGHAAVIGEPYLGVWPELAGRATVDDGLVFVSSWNTSSDAADLIGGVPVRLALGFLPHRVPTGTAWCEDYAKVFPFPDA